MLDTLKKYKTKATFFCIGDNVRKHPEIFEKVKKEGHSIGNHTYNHVNGWKTPLKEYVENVEKCAELVKTDLFRPPYGRISPKQFSKVKEQYSIIMWDVLSMDYDPEISAEKCFETVKKLTRPGSIIVFHDSLKAAEKLAWLLPKTLEFIIAEGYQPEPIMVAH